MIISLFIAIFSIVKFHYKFHFFFLEKDNTLSLIRKFKFYYVLSFEMSFLIILYNCALNKNIHLIYNKFYIFKLKKTNI